MVGHLQNDPKPTLVVPSFPISSNCTKGMKMCYDCAPKTISPRGFWVHGFFSLRKN